MSPRRRYDRIFDGIALWKISPERIVRAVGWLTQDAIAEDPHDLVANTLRHAASHFSVGAGHFMSIYLLAHGVVKAFYVAALLKNKLWAYSFAAAIFGGFVVYQLCRFILGGGPALVVLTLVDLAFISFIALEYQAVKSRKP